MATTTEWRASLALAGGRLECTIRRSARARLMRLTVDPRHTAVVTVPFRAARSKSEAERLAESFVGEREAWLRRHLERQARQKAELEALGPLRDGGTLLFRGEPHRLRIVAEPGRRRTVVTREGVDGGDELVVHPSAGERRELAAILEAWLRTRARSAIEREIDRHAAALAVAPVAVTIRDPRSRWGSCSRARRLSFSWRLILAPPEALETVVVHELAHLRVFGHGPQFWEVVAARRPDHRRWRRWLRDHSFELHGALDQDYPMEGPREGAARLVAG
ncbi:MAG: SprT family zinc-dependent metalloprotease [Candidatus Limnocylindrales bacterium]|jgi:predicted metal-dependent hydrolase